MPYFLGGCPTPAAPPTARPRLEAPGAVDLAATAVWRGLAAASSAASRRLLCKQDLATRRDVEGDLGGGEKPSTRENFRTAAAGTPSRSEKSGRGETLEKGKFSNRGSGHAVEVGEEGLSYLSIAR